MRKGFAYGPPVLRINKLGAHLHPVPAVQPVQIEASFSCGLATGISGGQLTNAALTMQTAQPGDERSQVPGVFNIHRREFEPLTDTGTRVADNGVGANLPILDEKMKARRSTLDHRLGGLDEEAMHANVAHPRNVATIPALPVYPNIANGNRKRRNPGRKSS